MYKLAQILREIIILSSKIIGKKVGICQGDQIVELYFPALDLKFEHCPLLEVFKGDFNVYIFDLDYNILNKVVNYCKENNIDVRIGGKYKSNLIFDIKDINFILREIKVKTPKIIGKIKSESYFGGKAQNIDLTFPELDLTFIATIFENSNVVSINFNENNFEGWKNFDFRNYLTNNNILYNYNHRWSSLTLNKNDILFT